MFLKRQQLIVGSHARKKCHIKTRTGTVNVCVLISLDNNTDVYWGTLAEIARKFYIFPQNFPFFLKMGK